MSNTANPLSSRIQRRPAGPCDLYTLRTPVDGFVSMRASFATNPDYSQSADVLQDMTVGMLDRGTQSRDRFEIARLLEDRGAKLDVTADGLRIDVSGQALKNDFPTLVGVLAEMLSEPLFDPDEFEKVKSTLIGDMQRDLESTSQQASGALSRRLFPSDHPNYTPKTATLIEEAEAATLEQIKEYYREHVGARDFRMAVVGDVDHAAVESAVSDAFEGWAVHDAPEVFPVGAEPKAPGRSAVTMPDKANVDVRIGHALDLLRGEDDFERVFVANFILGGNFSARLMNHVRDELGLTYHIRSSMSGVTAKYHGQWRTTVTLSTDALEPGIEATREVIRRFVEEGATEDELDAMKTTIAGAYQVGLATTTRIADKILANAEREFDVEYLDTFPDLIADLTLEEVNDAARRHFRPDDLHVAMAGTVPETVEA